MTDTKAWIVGSPTEPGFYACELTFVPPQIQRGLFAGGSFCNLQGLGFPRSAILRHAPLTVSDPPPLPEKPTPAERDEAEGEAVRAWVQSQKPVKEKLPSGLRGLLDYYQQSEVYWAPSTPQRIFMDYCDARYDCRPEPVVPPKPAPLMPFLIERRGEMQWANWESQLSYQLLGPLPSRFFVKSDGWHRSEQKSTGKEPTNDD